MADKSIQDQDYYPFNPALGKQLTHKVYEQRKSAALEVERVLRQYAAAHNVGLIVRAVETLGGKTFALSQNQNNRKGGLIGLAASAIAIGSADIHLYLNAIIRPILSSFNDADGNVRYFACESLYNVVKIARRSSLVYFPQIFDVLSRLCADPQQTVRSGAEVLDRLMKDIVIESHDEFALPDIIELLCEKIYSKNSFVRQFIVSWLRVLDSVPELDVRSYLPKMLEGLFQILSDQRLEIRAPCESLLGEFLHSIVERPENVNYSNMLNILVVHAQSEDELLQFTALLWIKQFLKVAGNDMIPFTAGILVAILPCLAYDGDSSKKQVREIARQVNQELMPLMPVNTDGGGDALQLGAVIDVLIQQLVTGAVSTRLATLRWLYHLLHQMPQPFFQLCGKILPALLNIVKIGSEEAVLSDLELLAEICAVSARSNVLLDAATVSVLNKDATSPTTVTLLICDTNENLTYFRYILTCAIVMFRDDRKFLSTRGAFIIRQLCLLLQPDKVYIAFAEILCSNSSSSDADLAAPFSAEFIAAMVHTLNTILMTTSEFYALRKELTHNEPSSSVIALTDVESVANHQSRLFFKLFPCWCYSPVTAISLCLLTQQYELAHTLTVALAKSGEITVDTLVELDRLVQLIESPVFTFLRLAILDGNQSLLKALHALLMILPQTEAFHTLKNRIQFGSISSAPYSFAASAQGQDLKENASSRPSSQMLLLNKAYDGLVNQFKRLNNIPELS